MKSLFQCHWGLLASVLVVAVGNLADAATPVSPTLTNAAGWDCLITGKGGEQGILFLTFSPDNTFAGAMISARVSAPKSSYTRPGIPSDRNPSEPAQPSITNTYGFTSFTGLWTFDSQGYTVGIFSYNVIDPEGSETNVNQISFRAKVASNKRFTASFSSSIGGNGTYRGVPLSTNLPDLSGAWTATEKNGPLTTYEWFSLMPSGVYPYPNLYFQSGYGPGYDFGGYCMASSQKRIAFGSTREFITATETNEITRGTVGTFIKKPTSLGGKTKGLSDAGTNVISYDAFWVSPLN